MHKTDIIQRLAYINVPKDAKLVEQSYPAFADTNVVVASFTPGNAGGLRIMLARFLCQSLEDATADLSNTPDAELLRRLHEACIKNTEATVNALIIDAVADELINDHRKMVDQLAEVAKELGFEYERPQDPFLQ